MKKIILVAIITGAVVGIVGGGLFFWMQKTKSTSSPPKANEPVVSQEKLFTWDDPAGFTFSYPDGLTINKHDEDKDNYAHVELTHASHQGNIIIWSKDTTASDVNAWVKTEKQFKDATVFDTTLGGQPAKKILITNPTKKVIIGTIYDELLFSLEAELGSDDYWQKIIDIIASSFTFKPVSTKPAADTGSGGDTSVDEEEVIQ